MYCERQVDLVDVTEIGLEVGPDDRGDRTVADDEIGLNDALAVAVVEALEQILRGDGGIEVDLHGTGGRRFRCRGIDGRRVIGGGQKSGGRSSQERPEEERGQNP